MNPYLGKRPAPPGNLPHALTVGLSHRFVQGSSVMDKDRVVGGTKKAAGTVKKAAGKATGNRRLEAKGRADKAEGHVRSALGKAKDAIRELVGGRH